MNIICVEDGSIDIDELEEEGLTDGKIVVYRKGSTPPFVLNVKEDKDMLLHQLKNAEKRIRELEFMVTVQRRKTIDELQRARDFFVEDCIDGDGCKTGDTEIVKDILEVEDYLDKRIKLLKNEPIGE